MFDDIIKHAPKDAQQRIKEYVRCAMEEEAPEGLRNKYGVKDFEEMTSHLVEYECGTPYIFEDKLIRDYRAFWRLMDAIFGDVKLGDVITGD